LEGKEEETVTRLARVGYDHSLGFLKGGIDAWTAAGKESDAIDTIPAQEFAERFSGDSLVIDVRKESEYRAEHVNEAYNRPLDVINEWTPSIDKEKHFFLHCAGGYRSMIAASILKARGISNFTEVAGGFSAISKTGIPKTDFICQSKLQQV
jgi:hydroxyacylglutathione hydrolase